MPLAVVVQPDPMLEERPAGPFRTSRRSLGRGGDRGPGALRHDTAAGAAADGGGPASTPAAAGRQQRGGQAQPANAPAQNPQPNTQQPTTTGQGAGEQPAQPTEQGQPKGQAGQSKTPPASGGSATSDVGPGAKPAPQAK